LGLKPNKLTVAPNEWNQLQRQLNYIISDIYSYIDELKGVDDKPPIIHTPPIIEGETGPTFEALTASRLLALDADKIAVSSDLFGWITGTDDQITVTDDEDGTVTLAVPIVEDAAYGAGWNGDAVHAPSQNALYDVLASIITDLSGFPDELKNLVTAEIEQLEAIGTVTISAAQWGYLGDLDQALKIGSDVSLGYITLKITDTDGTVEGQIWYDASEDKLKFKTAAGTETITSA